jgi:hypothetical protein
VLFVERVGQETRQRVLLDVRVGRVLVEARARAGLGQTSYESRSSNSAFFCADSGIARYGCITSALRAYSSKSST